jgi:signal transduction histidine kinase
MLHRLLISIFIVFFLKISTHAQPIVWDGKSRFLIIGDQVSILEDDSKVLSLEHVIAPENVANFKLSNKKILDYPLKAAVIWVKFNILNTTHDDLLIEIAQPLLPSVELYYADAVGEYELLKSGYHEHLYKKDIPHHHSIFPLLSDTATYYLRIISTTQPIPIKIWNQEEYNVKMSNQKLIYGLYMGFMLFIILYNLFLFLSLRRWGYLHYSVLISLYVLFATIYDGFILYIFPNIILLKWYLIIPVITIPVASLYCIHFLEVKKYDPRSYIAAWVLLIYFVMYVVVFRFLSLETLAISNQLHSLVNLLFITFIAVRVGLKGNRLGYYFALAYFIFFLIGSIEVYYSKTGDLPYNFELSYISIAFLIEVIFLSYLLSKRFEWEKNDIEKAKDDAQLQLLEKTQENEKMVREQNIVLEQKVKERTAALNKSLEELKETQNQLIQKEKMASLGELTAGIAHEIQNPLNFVNNFSELSQELAHELKEELERPELDKDLINDLISDLNQNQEKINMHGKRASSIVKGMLEHSRKSTGERRPTDINALVDEYLRLSYHGMRAKDKNFNVDFKMDLDKTIGDITIVPQDMGRVFLNLFNNAFYAVQQRFSLPPPPAPPFGSEGGEKPLVKVTTQKTDNHIIITIKDNGIGIPDTIKSKIFQPFFTTKPTGEGTGLGLSLSYDIVTKGHNGALEVESTEGGGSTFVIKLPL